MSTSSNDDAADWRNYILQHFSEAGAAASRLTVVSDPDGLLTEQGVVARIRERQYELITFDDHVAFRFAYESRFRQHWDRGDSTHLVVVIRTEDGDWNGIPHDLLEDADTSGRLLSFSLPELFPDLSPSVVAELDYDDFDALAQAITNSKPGALGANGTRDFILRNVFEIAPEIIQKSHDLLRVLLRLHYRAQTVPIGFVERLIELLTISQNWSEWPLERVVSNREAFLHFLQERWPHFLAERGFSVVQGREPPSPAISGPVDIPFNHDDVRVYVDNFFAEGLLNPTTAIDAEAVEGTWYRIGVAGNPAEDAGVRLKRLIETFTDDLPQDGANHSEWSSFALRWAEAIRLRWKMEDALPAELAGHQETLHDDIEDRFASWILESYGALFSLQHVPRPKTLDKIPKFLAHHRRKPEAKEKTALVVVDGLALDQWLVLKESLDHLRFNESTAFACVPTLTSVSRQSIFAGEPPQFYGKYLDTTRRESKHWQRFWRDQGLKPGEVAYVCEKKESQESFFDRIWESVDHPQCKVAGIVVGAVDQMIHGTVTGTGGMHASVRHWARHENFGQLVEGLIQRGFDIFLTADHGNIEGVGIGKPNVGKIANERGERVHVFDHELLRSDVQAKYPGSIKWPSVALPDDYLPLFPPGRSAFISEGQRTVAHGGISMEEIIVPFVEILEKE